MTTYSKEESKEKIKQLLERYRKSYLEAEGRRADDFSEKDTVTKFIKPLIQALGWNLLSMQETREEVKHVDLVLYHEEKPYIAFEFKPLDFYDLRRRIDTKKLVHYSKVFGAKYAVASRFKETIIFKTETEEEVRIFARPEDYIHKFEMLWKHTTSIAPQNNFLTSSKVHSGGIESKTNASFMD